MYGNTAFDWSGEEPAAYLQAEQHGTIIGPGNQVGFNAVSLTDHLGSQSPNILLGGLVLAYVAFSYWTRGVRK